MSDAPPLHEAQLGLGDMSPNDFRGAAAKVTEQVAGYLERLESLPVLPDLEPGEVRRQLPPSPPAGPEPMDAILADYARLIEPNITHWQHPGFMAYFPSVASGPGILGEWLAAGLNSNVMLWRNAPASTELEELTVSWLRQLFGLPDVFDGMFTDTASISSLLAIVAARHAVPGLDARDEGLSGRPGIGRLRLYCSTEAHSSIEKAAMVAGVGRAGVRRIEADEALRMRPDRLAAAITEDRAAGWLPFCVAATIGTTSSTSIDPTAEIAAICRREALWLHVDAAYAGAAAVAPEMRPLFAGWELADSIVVNPHKWLFTPFDASLLLFRSPEVFRGAFSLVPEYLRVRREGEAHDFHEYGIQLGRRFRALKLWMLIRYFGADGLAARVREHCRMAQELASWVEADADWQVMAPVPFATVCLRHRPAALAGRESEPDVARELDARSEAILDHVNRSGEIFLSHTRLAGRHVLRVSIGNPRQTMDHVRRCWSLLREAAAASRSST
ncbi:MAG TPA: pyridoxal-dependent decarboxylase [Candidatus Nanopelagicales bacterium]|nr:pyridoxal-dependent decarboxylase [Candidatus Nanopelagicales bacterium]